MTKEIEEQEDYGEVTVGYGSAEQRKAKIEQLVRERTFQMRQKFIGRRMEVLLENTKSSIEISGHTENFLEVMLPRKNCCPNQIITAEITENTKEGFLKGKIA